MVLFYSATIINITHAPRDRMWPPDRKSDGARPEVICILESHCFRVENVLNLRENNVTLICKLLPVAPPLRLPVHTSGRAPTSGVGRKLQGLPLNQGVHWQGRPPTAGHANLPYQQVLHKDRVLVVYNFRPFAYCGLLVGVASGPDT